MTAAIGNTNVDSNFLPAQAPIPRANKKELKPYKPKHFQALFEMTKLDQPGNEKARQAFLDFIQRKEEKLQEISLHSKGATVLTVCTESRTELRNLLDVKLEDYNYIKYILECYQKTLESPILRMMGDIPELLVIVLIWISDKSQFLSLGGTLLATLDEELNENSRFYARLAKNFENRGNGWKFAIEVFKSPQVREKLEIFLESVKAYPQNQQLPLHQGPKKRIVVLSTLAGGGHVSPAKAVEQYFLKQQQDVLYLNVGEIRKEKSVLKLLDIKLSDGTPVDDAYVAANWHLNGRKKRLTELLFKYENYKKITHPELFKKEYINDLIERIQAFNPDILISTANQEYFLTSIALRINRPLICISTDYNFHEIYLNEIDIANQLPSYARLFTVTLAAPGIANVPSDPAIQVTGIPVHSAFESTTDVAELDEIRAQWDVKEGEVVYTISRGLWCPEKSLLVAINDLIDPAKPLNIKLRVFVVCGENAAAKDKLAYLEKEYPKEGKPVRFTILGKLEPAVLAKLFDITDLHNMKPGGLITTEFLKKVGPAGTRKRVIACPEHYPHELSNGEYIQRLGLGIVSETNQPNRAHQIDLIHQLINQPLQRVPSIDWERNLSALVENKIREHRSFYGAQSL